MAFAGVLEIDKCDVQFRIFGGKDEYKLPNSEGRGETNQVP